MRKVLLALALALCLTPSVSWGQCTGVFPANTLCGNLTGSPRPPAAFTSSGSIVGPSSSTTSGLATWANSSGTQFKDASGTTIVGNYTISGTNNFVGIYQISGNTITWPNTTGAIAFTTLNPQTFTGVNTFTSNVVVNGMVSATTISGTTISAGTLRAPAAFIGALSGTTISANTISSSTTNAAAGFFEGANQNTYVLLNTVNVVNTPTISDTTTLTGTYSNYEIVFTNVIPVTDSVTLGLQVFSGGSFKGSSYNAQTLISAAGAPASTNATTNLQLTSGNALRNSSSGFSGSIRVNNPAGAVQFKPFYGTGYHFNGTNPVTVQVAGEWAGGIGPVTGFQISATSGNISLGTMRIYGIK